MFSATCSERCTWKGRPSRRAATADSSAAGTARTEWTAMPVTACATASRSASQGVDPVGPRPDAAVAVAELRALGRHPEAGGEVERVEERDPDAGLPGRLDQHVAHLVGVGVGRAVRAVVDVVELAHARDPGRRHLAVRRSRQGEVGVRVEPRGDGVHLVAPGPEGAALALGAAAERAVEGVAVGVGEAGDDEAAHGDRAGRVGAPG